MLMTNMHVGGAQNSVSQRVFTCEINYLCITCCCRCYAAAVSPAAACCARCKLCVAALYWDEGDVWEVSGRWETPSPSPPLSPTLPY